MAPDKLQTIEVTYNPPPDGSYPPRFLTSIPGRETIWLPDQERIWLVKNQLAALRDGDVYSLILNLPHISARYAHLYKAKFYVNGEPLLYTHVLQDGDFIYRSKRMRFIFQVDPVADRKRRFAIQPGTQFTFTISHKLGKRAVVNEIGLSVAGKKGFFPWQEVMNCSYKRTPWWNENKYILQIEYPDSKPYVLVDFTLDDAKTWQAWVESVAPFDLSWSHNPDKDAYNLAIQEKIINLNRKVPYSNLRLLGKPSIWEQIYDITSPLLLFAMMLAFAVAITPPDDEGVVRNGRSGLLILLFASLLIGLGFLLFVMTLVERLQYYRNRRLD